jgi:hypothetical protein
MRWELKRVRLCNRPRQAFPVLPYYAGGKTGLQWFRVAGIPKWATIFIPSVQLLLLSRVFYFQPLLLSRRNIKSEQSCKR